MYKEGERVIFYKDRERGFTGIIRGYLSTTTDMIVKFYIVEIDFSCRNIFNEYYDYPYSCVCLHESMILKGV